MVVRFLDEMLDPTARLHAALVGPAFILMMIMCILIELYSSKTTWRVRETAYMEWTAYSPGLNPIENL